MYAEPYDNGTKYKMQNVERNDDTNGKNLNRLIRI